MILLPFFVEASPLDQSFVRVERQSTSCQTAVDCLSSSTPNVTTDFVNCVEGVVYK